MPILGCIALFIVLYFFISYKEKEEGRDKVYENVSCSSCGNKVAAEDRNCSFCNQELKRECQNCGKIISVGWRYCPYCGHVGGGE